MMQTITEQHDLTLSNCYLERVFGNNSKQNCYTIDNDNILNNTFKSNCKKRISK